jgi:hypothetical protein
VVDVHALAEHLQQVVGHGARLGRGRDQFGQVQRGMQLRDEIVVALREARERSVDVDRLGCIGVRHGSLLQQAVLLRPI